MNIIIPGYHLSQQQQRQRSFKLDSSPETGLTKRRISNDTYRGFGQGRVSTSLVDPSLVIESAGVKLHSKQPWAQMELKPILSYTRRKLDIEMPVTPRKSHMSSIMSNKHESSYVVSMAES